jgi:hypothetical protein
MAQFKTAALQGKPKAGSAHPDSFSALATRSSKRVGLAVRC